MKTNQLMEINLGKFGTVHVWHKTMMGKLEDIAILANNANIINGEKPFDVKKKVRDFLENTNTWKFIIEVNRKRYESLDAVALSTNREILEQLPKMSNSKIKYSEVLKQKLFNNVIRRQTRGKLENRGTWANVYILLDFAVQLNVQLKYEMYRVFIEEKILQHRDAGGEAFKELNILIDKSLVNAPKAPYRYINIANLTKEVIGENDPLPKGYNQKEHNAIIQKRREKIIDTSCTMIKMNIVKTYQQLEDFIINFPI